MVVVADAEMDDWAACAFAFLMRMDWCFVPATAHSCSDRKG